MTELRTERLRLMPCPGDWHPEQIEAALRIRVPRDWPLNELRDVLPDYARALEEDATLEGWGPWLMVDAADTLVGDIGFTGRSDEDGEVEIGFNVLPAYRGNRYASEAVSALSRWALEQRGVECVEAACARMDGMSKRVFERAGFTPVAESTVEIRFELRPRAFTA
jgi:ribosomal-protein-alanine N-acetyltransferase